MTTKIAKQGKAAAVRKPAAKSMSVTKVPELSGAERAEKLAQMAVRPSVNAAAVMMECAQPLGEQDVVALMETLTDGMETLATGDLSRCEAMLYGQAHALQTIFMNFSRRALKQEYQKNLESFLRMALKAQNQCRMTLETLATIKNPPVVFARQANIANGPQQVNNGTVPTNADHSAPTRALSGAGTHAAIAKTEQTELLEASNGQGLDTGTAGTAGRADPHLEAVGAGHRPAQR